LISRDYNKEQWLEHFPFDGFPEKNIIQCIKDLPLSRNTLKDIILNMKTNIADKLTKDNRSYTFLSICLDNSTYVTLSARPSIIARFCSGDETQRIG
jgi:hypothetical protein